MMLRKLQKEIAIDTLPTIFYSQANALSLSIWFVILLTGTRIWMGAWAKRLENIIFSNIKEKNIQIDIIFYKQHKRHLVTVYVV